MKKIIIIILIQLYILCSINIQEIFALAVTSNIELMVNDLDEKSVDKIKSLEKEIIKNKNQINRISFDKEYKKIADKHRKKLSDKIEKIKSKYKRNKIIILFASVFLCIAFVSVGIILFFVDIILAAPIGMIVSGPVVFVSLYLFAKFITDNIKDKEIKKIEKEDKKNVEKEYKTIAEKLGKKIAELKGELIIKENDKDKILTGFIKSKEVEKRKQKELKRKHEEEKRKLEEEKLKKRQEEAKMKQEEEELKILGEFANKSLEEKNKEIQEIYTELSNVYEKKNINIRQEFWIKLKHLYTILEKNSIQKFPFLLSDLVSSFDQTEACKTFLDGLVEDSDKFLIFYKEKLQNNEYLLGNTAFLDLSASVKEDRETYFNEFVIKLVDILAGSIDENIKKDIVCSNKRAIDGTKNTPLIMAVKNENIELALKLIPYYGLENFKSKTGAGNSALHLACFFRMNKIIFAIVKHAQNKGFLDKLLCDKNHKGKTIYDCYITEFNKDIFRGKESKEIIETLEKAEVIYKLEKVFFLLLLQYSILTEVKTKEAAKKALSEKIQELLKKSPGNQYYIQQLKALKEIDHIYMLKDFSADAINYGLYYGQDSSVFIYYLHKNLNLSSGSGEIRAHPLRDRIDISTLKIKRGEYNSKIAEELKSA